MKKLFLFAALFVTAAFSSCSKHDNEINDVEPPVPPETTPLAITFAEGNELFFDVDETKTVHYTITGGSEKNVVKAEMQTPDDAYVVETTPTSATEGTITITAKKPETENCIVVTVSDGSQIVTAKIAVSTNSIPEKLAITFAEGNSLEFDTGETKTVHYTITGGSENTVVNAELQTPDDAYTVETMQTSATEGTIKITAQTPTDNRVIVTVSDGSQTVTAEIAVSTNPVPEELAITFAEGYSLEFGVNETKTVHYTITGGSDNTVVKTELQTPDDAYAIETTPTSATEGTITITAKTPSNKNRIIVTVSDGSQIVTATIAVALKASFDGKTVVVEFPGSLGYWLASYDKSSITELTVIGTLNDEDIATLKKLPNLAILDMENVNLEALPADTFRNKTSLTSVKLPKTLKRIGSYAFSGCTSLISITIPDSVTGIGEGAFYGCSSLTSVTIPDSVTAAIAVDTFRGCSGLTSVTIGNGVTCIGSAAFRGCSSLTSITIPDSVTGIYSYAFYGCSNLTGELVIPDSVPEIEYCAFSGCSSLTSVTIGNSVRFIGNYAFDHCSGLTSVTIGNSVTLIDSDTFRGCSGLISVYCKAIVPPIAPASWSDVKATATLYVPTGSKAAYAAAAEWRDFTTIEEVEF